LKYTAIPAPILAIYALPHDRGPLVNGDAAARGPRRESFACRSCAITTARRP